MWVRVNGVRLFFDVEGPSLVSDGPAMRQIRGGDIGLVFQEPMSSLSAFHSVGVQLIEAVRLQPGLAAAHGPGSIR